MSTFIRQFRVLLGAVMFITLCTCFVLLAASGLVVYLPLWKLRGRLRYLFEVAWARSITTVVNRGCLGQRFLLEDTLKHPQIQTPVLVMGVHPTDMMIAPYGTVVMPLLNGRAISIVAKKQIAFIIRWPLKLLGLGVFIDRKDRTQSTLAIKRALEDGSETLLFPEGTRPRPQKIADQRKKYRLDWLQNTSLPKKGGVWAYLEATRAIGVVPRVLFVSYRVESADWESSGWHRLVGTTVEFLVEDISGLLVTARCEEEVQATLNNKFRGVNSWRSQWCGWLS